MLAEKIKIVIIDDSLDWVKQLATLLNMEDDLIVAGVAHEKQEGYELIKLKRPDVVLLDLCLTGDKPDGLLFINKIKDETKIIVTAESKDPEHVKEAILSGAKEFVNKDSLDKLPLIIGDVHKRRTTAEIIAEVAKENEAILLQKKEDDILTELHLTNAEKKVFRYLKLNHNREQISQLLVVSKDTIKNHIHNILKKLSVNDTEKAIAKIREMVVK